MKKQRERKKKKVFDRYTILFIVMLLIFSGILAQLTYLQVVRAEDYKEKANVKGTREIPEFAPRGKIVDRNNNILATNIKSYILIYNEGDESSKEFFPTMSKVFKVLDENGETLKDDFELKLNPFSFKFKSDDEKVKKDLEVRFKRDRGFNEEIRKKLFPKKEKLTEDDENAINKELLKMTPEEVFYKLVKNYQLYKILDESEYSYKEMAKLDDKKLTELLLKKHSLEDIRRYLIIKDTIKMQSFSGYKPVIVANNIKESTAFIFLQILSDMPGIDVNTQPLRSYPNGELGSAFLGYISKINGGMSDKYEARGYDTSSDYVGMAGLESAFEDRLKGSKGGRIVKLNSQGRVIQELGRRESYPGQNIQLTVDKDVQAVAEKALDDTMKQLQSQGGNHSDGTNTTNATRAGAVVVDVNTGGIIALASRPGFDPNFFSIPGRLDSDKDIYNRYFNTDLVATAEEYIKSRGLDPNKATVDSLFPIDSNASTTKKAVRYDKFDILPKPMYNYATMGFTQPGSTFKPLTAIAGLEEGVIDSNTTINDLGTYTKNNFNGKCWAIIEQGFTHGSQTVVTALQNSCNYFFYEVGDRLMGGVNDVKSDTLAKYAWKFGLGVDPKGNGKKSTGIEIYEDFGFTSNLEYIKSQIPFYKVNEMIAAVKNMNLDLVVHESDSEEIRGIKNNIVDICKKRMIDKKSKSENDFLKELKAQIKQLVSLTPELNGKLTNGDISAISNKIIQFISDGYGEITTPANVYNASIGQGYSRFTPLQLANYMATVVNGGKRYKLHLVDKFSDASGNVIQQVKPEVIEDVKLKPSTVATVIDGMRKVTEEGTASTAFQGFPIENGGKTGSATFQNNQHDVGREAFGVYVGFAPLNNPKIAVCIVVYDGAHGGYVAPVARAIYETYFKNDILAQKPDYQFMYPISK